MKTRNYLRTAYMIRNVSNIKIISKSPTTNHEDKARESTNLVMYKASVEIADYCDQRFAYDTVYRIPGVMYDTTLLLETTPPQETTPGDTEAKLK